MLVLRYDNKLDNRYDAKFQKRWEGPFFIFQKFKNGSYRLEDLTGRVHKTPVNGWRLKPCLCHKDPLATYKEPLPKEEPYEGMIIPFGFEKAPSCFQNTLKHHAKTDEELHDEGPIASKKCFLELGHECH